jgi:hypothetical protein
VPDGGHTGATRGCLTGATQGPDGVPDGGHMEAGRGARRGCLTGATRGPDGVPNEGHMGAGQGAQQGPDGGQTGWRMEGLFTFKRKTDMFCIRVI